jgi:hypothetical protein
MNCKARTCEFPVVVSFPSYGIAPRYAVLSSPPTGPCDYIRTVFAVLTLFSCQFLLFPLSPSNILHSPGRDPSSHQLRRRPPASPPFSLSEIAAAPFVSCHLYFQILCPVRLDFLSSQPSNHSRYRFRFIFSVLPTGTADHSFICGLALPASLLQYLPFQFSSSQKKI